MKKLFNIMIGISGIIAGLVVSACQPQPAATVKPASPTPTSTSQPVTAPTDTPQPEEPAKTGNLSVQWKFKTGGAIWGTPAIAGGTAYIGSDDGNLYAVDVKTGQELWKVTTGGIVRSLPAVENGLVYFASDDGNLYAVHAKDGKQAWRVDIGNAYPRDKRENLGTSTSPTGWDYIQSSPVAIEGQVFIGSYDGNVYALDAASGKVTWTFKTGNKVRATPTVDNGVVFIGSWDESFYALDARTGKQLWVSPVEGEVQTHALVVDGLVITASRKASVQALDAKTGQLVWEYPYGNNMWVESSPSLVDDRIFIGASGSLMVVGLDYKSGKPSSMFISKAFHWSTPLVIKDTLYIGGAAFSDPDNGALFALPLTNGKLPLQGDGRRLLKVPDTLEYSGKISGVAGSPVLADGVIYFGGLDGNLYAVKD